MSAAGAAAPNGASLKRAMGSFQAGTDTANLVLAWEPTHFQLWHCGREPAWHSILDGLWFVEILELLHAQES